MPASIRPAQLGDFVGITRWWVHRQPDKVAYRFFEDGQQENGSLTYGELDRRARTFAAKLQAEDLVGQRCMLLFGSGLDYIVAFLACLYAGAVPVPAYPPEPHRLQHTLARLQSIIADAQAPVVITSSMIRTFAENIIAQTKNEALGRLRWLVIDQTDGHTPEDWREPALVPSSLAFLQYTSGSTSSPKGVEIHHGGLVQGMQMMQDGFGFRDEEETFACWLPLYHDMGLIGEMLSTLFVGGSMVLMPPHAFLKRPARWLQLISQYRATITAAPNFAYDLAVRKVSPAERDQLDLSSMRVFGNGAEPVRAETLRRFTRYFAPTGLRPESITPCYGMAEVGVFATAPVPLTPPPVRSISRQGLAKHRVVEVEPSDEDALEVVGAGRWAEGSRLEIVHPDTRRPVRPGRVGEIWIAGPHLAAGYFDRAEATEATFRARLADGDDDTPFLRTGDLGFVADGELYVTGRRKDLLIIRGRNLYPQDIEKTMDETRATLPQIRPGCAAAVSIEVEGVEQIVVFQEVDPSRGEGFEPEKILSTLRDAIVRDHEVQPYSVVLLDRGTLPKTSSGKVMRHACKRAYLQDFADGSLKVLARHELTVDAAPSIDLASPAAASARTEEQRRLGAETTDGLLAWLRDHAPRRIDAGRGDAQRTLDPGVVRDLGDRGLLGMQVSRDHGGLGLGLTDMLRVVQQLAAIDLSLASFVVAHNALGVGPVMRAASRELADELLPRLARGRELAAYALAETTGSTPAAIRSEARRDGDGWQLHGNKLAVAGAAWASHVHVFVRHARSHAEGGAEGGAQGSAISAFVVPLERFGWRLGPETTPVGLRGVPRHDLVLEGVRVDEAGLLGAPGEGEAVATGAHRMLRLLTAAQAIGGAKRCMQLMTRWASRRPIDTGWLLDHGVTLERMNETACELTGLEALADRIAARLDAAEAVPGAVIDAVKVAASETLWRAADQLVQALGDRGLGHADVASRLLRDARLLRLDGGSTERLYDRVGSELLSQPDSLVAFIEEGLGGPEAAAALREVAVPLAARVASASKRSAATAHRARFAAGRLLGWALQRGALEGSAQGRNPVVAQAVAVMTQRASALAAALLDGDGLQARLPTARAMAGIVGGYAAQIGDLDPLQLGTRQVAIPELLRSAPASPSPSAAASPARAASRPAPRGAPIERARRSAPRDGSARGKVAQTSARAKSPETSAPAETPARAPAASGGPKTSAVTELEAWMVAWIAEELGMDPATLAKQVGFSSSSQTPFSALGIDSVTAIQFVAALEDELGRSIPTSTLWDHDNVHSLARHLLETTD